MSGKLIKSFAWDFAGRVGSQITGLIIGIILARLLTPAQFGLIGMAMVFISVSEIFTNLGLSSALIQRSDPTEEHYSSSFFLNIGAALLLTIIFVAAAPLIAAFFKNDEITLLVRVLSVSLLIGSLSVVQEARLRKKMRFDLLTKARIISSVVSGLIGISMAFAGFGVWSLVVQTLLGRVLTTSYYWFVSEWRPKLLFRIRAIKELWAYSLNLFFSGIIDTAYNQLDSIIIARLFSANELGLYSRAKSLNRFAIKYSSESVGTITFPAMAEIKNDRERMISLGLKAETLVAFLSFGLLGWLFVSAGPLILTLFGSKWEASIRIFRILCLSGFAYPISAATLSMLKASGDSKSFLKVEVWKKIVGLAGFVVGFMFGLEGFLISLIFTGAISVYMNMYVTGRSLDMKIRHQLYPLLPYLAVSVTSAFICEIINISFKSSLLNFILISLLFVVLFFGINYIIKTEGYFLFIQQSKSLIEKLKMKFVN